ncbi:MAG: 2Fe-2S iron-sulfur cluster-binding protein, partial [Candidatus Latescibacteria bacterium]|nr:2Fe-2S iron-sulfur cluster-binding protein [Candidatus Latescibacterota bacterium]
MSVIRLTIDDQEAVVPEGSTLLRAAEELGIEIPTLCHLDGLEPTTSCMVCVVHDLQTDRLIPACSMPASEGMVIQTRDEQVCAARKDTLDLLLSEHVGDCEAPCQRACPAHMDVPTMVRLIQSQSMGEAIATVKGDIALPATLGRICPAPCESGCNRKGHDGAVSVCMLKRYTADADLAREDPYAPELERPSGKRVAIVGGGPTGLSAAYYLIQEGHAARIYDDHPQLGGMLRYGVLDQDLPKPVLDAEIARILALGVEFHPNTAFGRDITLEGLRQTHDAVVLAFGTVGPETPEIPGLELSRRGVAIKRNTHETSLDGVFAGGNAVSESRLAIRALAHGKEIARSVDQFLRGEAVIGIPGRFASRIGKLLE